MEGKEKEKGREGRKEGEGGKGEEGGTWLKQVQKVQPSLHPEDSEQNLPSVSFYLQVWKKKLHMAKTSPKDVLFKANMSLLPQEQPTSLPDNRFSKRLVPGKTERYVRFPHCHNGWGTEISRNLQYPASEIRTSRAVWPAPVLGFGYPPHTTHSQKLLVNQYPLSCKKQALFFI